MRELMINKIKGYYWLSFDCLTNKKYYSEADYVAWLNSLSDEDFLSEYNATSEAIYNMG